RDADADPERAVRSLLHRMGVRFRLQNRDLPGSPDVANRRRGWAIFVNGCFWHQHPGCPRAAQPKTNRSFWNAKLARNVKRDEVALAGLSARSYSVLVVWECETR